MRLAYDYEKLYANKMDNLKEMENFLEMYNLPRLNKEETEKMNRPITSNQIESITLKNTQETKVQNQMASWVNSSTHLQKS